jgi:hypothetical protein
MHHMEQAPTPDFDPSFASPAEWAAMYRACGLQVVPAHTAVKGGEWKFPLLPWKEFQDNLVSDAVFDRWYGPSGEHSSRQNMGIITGKASGNVFIVDLDDQKGPQAQAWWIGLLAVHNSNLDIETVEQRTGGGGRQKLFRAPADWVAPTNKTSINIDVRGQAGFGMTPPSRHESGHDYEWLPGRAPWEIEIAAAPEWLLEAIETLVERHGGVASGPRTQTASGAEFDAFGNQIDSRETYMRDLVWAAVIGLRRDCPIPPGTNERDAVFADYERNTRSRLALDGKTNAERLEEEGRGQSLFANKWRRAVKKWDGAVKEAADQPRPKPDDFEEATAKAEDQAKASPANLFEYLSVDQIKLMPDPDWLIDGLVVERSLGFIYGPPGCLKTFIALDMALSFTVGMPDWWGRPIQRKGAVVYISSEGQADLKFRIQAWEQHNKVLADDSPFFLIRQTINFMKPEDVGKLLATVQAIADLSGVPIMAVFVDTVSRVLPGSDENLQKDMTLFIAACDAVRQRFGATVIGLHHTSRNGNIRGSTVIPGAGDFLVEVRREPGALTGSIFATKIKSAEDGWEQHFKVEKIALGDIVGRSSLVVAPVNVAPKKEGGAEWPDKDTCRQILAAIDEQWASGKPWCFAINTSRAAAPNIMKRWRIKREVVKDILATWNANGVIAEDICDQKNHVTGYRKLVDI